jgi:integrase
MFRFALTRELVERNPLETVTKRDAGGPNVQRDRVLSVQELEALSTALPKATLHKRSALAVTAILGTACRVGELTGAEWKDIDFSARTLHLSDTKNQRPHTVHLSDFSLRQFQQLAALRESGPWVFPNARCTGPVDSKSLGKQLADRQRPHKDPLQGRSKATLLYSSSGDGGLPMTSGALRRLLWRALGSVGT